MFYVYEVISSYGDLHIYGPYESLNQAKSSTTDTQNRGIDGDKTTYTFVKIEPDGQEILGVVTFEDEYEVEDGESLKSQIWYV